MWRSRFLKPTRPAGDVNARTILSAPALAALMARGVRVAAIGAAVLALGRAGLAQEVTKARLRVQQVEATPSVVSSVSGAGGATLRQILDAADSQLLNALEQTRKFELAPRDLRAVIREQDFAQSGNVNRLDPQTAKILQMAGVKYVAVVRVDNFQDVTSRMTLEGPVGTTQGERRTIQIQAVVQVVDATSAIVLRSTSVRLEPSTTNEAMAGGTTDGRQTNSLIGSVSSELARRAANEITDAIYPAKVVGYTMGTVTFNRTRGSGVEPGQFWEALAPGQRMVDPDTGEALGAEEVSIGWVVVTDPGDRFSKAEAIADNGIERNTILRLRTTLPPGINPNARAKGSASAAGAAVPQPESARLPADPAAAPAPQAAVNSNPTLAPAPAPVPAGADGSRTQPLRFAIFIKNRAKSVPDSRVMYLEDQVAQSATDTLVEVIRREDVANAVARFAKEGANAGTNSADADKTDRLLSDRTTALALAQMLGADALITASISALDRETRDYNDGTNKTFLETYTLRCTYGIIDGATGGSLAAGPADAVVSYRTTENLKVTADPTTELLTDCGRQIGEKIRAQLVSARTRRPTAGAEEIDVQVNMFLADMRIPRLEKTGEGQYRVMADTVDVGVMNAELLVDGVSAGTAPGVMHVRPGLHKLRLERPLMESEERMVNARRGLVLNIPMRMSADGWARWKENAQFFDTLRANQILSEGELAKARGIAEFLTNSHLKLDLNTAGWGGLLGH